MDKSGIVVVSKGGSSYQKIMSYLDENAQTDVLRVDSIGEALDIIYSANAEILIADMGDNRKNVQEIKNHPFYNASGDARENLSYLCWYINTHCGDRLGLSDLSAMIGVTPNYLCRIFREEMGVTLSHYIEKIRLARAANELIMTDRFVQDISVAFGYRNDSYFCRVFKKNYGLTPADYREKMRRNLDGSKESGET